MERGNRAQPFRPVSLSGKPWRPCAGFVGNLSATIERAAPDSGQCQRQPWRTWNAATYPAPSNAANVPRLSAATVRASPSKTALQAVRRSAPVRARLKHAVRFASRLRPSATQSANAAPDSSQHRTPRPFDRGEHRTRRRKRPPVACVNPAVIYAAFTLAAFTLAAPAPCLQCPRRLLV